MIGGAQSEEPEGGGDFFELSPRKDPSQAAAMRTIGLDELLALSTGATVLGTGGGGDPFIGRLMAEAAIRRYGPIRLVDLDELPEEGLVIPAAMMGAPTVMVEKIPNGDEIRRAVEQLERVLEQKAVAIMVIEAGGINSMIPLAVAAQLGLPVVNADSMGRAFPELQMTSFHLFGIRSTPMVVVDEKGNSLLLDTIDNRWTERLSRTATVQMGGSSIIALYPLTTREAREASIPDSLGKELELGRLLRDRTLPASERLRRLLQRMNGRLIFHGKVVDVVRSSTDAFVRGTATLAGLDEDEGSTLRLEFQNENLVAVRDGEPVAMVPDLISTLDQETLIPITTETLIYGQRALVIALPCATVWRTEKGLETAGPRYFGYDFDYRPIEAQTVEEES